MKKSYDFAMTRANTLFFASRFELVAELDALGLTRKGLLPPRLERGLKWLVEPLARSLAIVKDRQEKEDDDEDGEEDYEGRVK